MNPIVLAAAFLWGPAAGPAPEPRLAPDAVVRIVVGALHHNDSPMPNAGVFTAYRFASPANHAVTGPYGRFLRIVKSAAFAPLLSVLGAGREEFSAISIAGDHAIETTRISVSGRRPIEYHWSLLRQPEGVYRGCWMVDGVTR